MADYAIEVERLTKIYHLYKDQKDRLLEILSIRGRMRHRDHYALDHVSFKIEKGTAVGIIGTNGAGKSTLLKILNEVLEPTSGSVTVRGKTSALLELGAGFNPEYTGLENVYLNGLLMGFGKEQMDRKLKDILSFADIGEYIHQPVRTYSSGMFARLAFAVSVHTDPDILIVDEALSVGDIRFQQKCFRCMMEMKQTRTILFVTHDMAAVTKFCDRVIWLEQGRIMAMGDPAETIKKYQAYLSDTKNERQQSRKALKKEARERQFMLEPVRSDLESYGTGKASVLETGLFEEGNPVPVHMIRGGQRVKFVMRVRQETPAEHPIAGLTLTDRMGTNIFSMNSYISHDDIYAEGPDHLYICEFDFPPLNEGLYSISPAFAEGTQSDHVMHQWVFDAYELQVVTPFLEGLNGVLAVTGYHYSVV